MPKVERVRLPQGKIYVMQDSSGHDIINSAYIVWNKNYENKLNNNFDETQKFIDNTVINYLQEYVSLKTGAQAKSIKLASIAGSGEVRIAVPYAHYQAYSPLIKKMDGKRGPRPFERMKADKLETIKSQAAAYSRRLNS